MPEGERVTITLPDDLARDIDRHEKDRGKFITEAVRNELDRRRRAELLVSLEKPHPETYEVAELGFEDWARSLPEEDISAFVDSSAGKPIRWIPGEGWVEDHE